MIVRIISGPRLGHLAPNLRCKRLLLQILLRDDMVTGTDSIACALDFLAIENKRRPIADHLQHKLIGWLFKCLSEIAQ